MSNLYPFRVSCAIRTYYDETDYTVESVSWLVMAFDYNEAVEKFKEHYQHCCKYKLKFVNLEVEEPII